MAISGWPRNAHVKRSVNHVWNDNNNIENGYGLRPVVHIGMWEIGFVFAAIDQHDPGRR